MKTFFWVSSDSSTELKTNLLLAYKCIWWDKWLESLQQRSQTTKVEFHHWQYFNIICSLFFHWKLSCCFVIFAILRTQSLHVWRKRESKRRSRPGDFARQCQPAERVVSETRSEQPDEKTRRCWAGRQSARQPGGAAETVEMLQWPWSKRGGGRWRLTMKHFSRTSWYKHAW